MTTTATAPGACEVLTQMSQLACEVRRSVKEMSGSEASTAIRKAAEVIAAVEALKVELVGQFNKSRVWDSGTRDASPEKVLAREHLLDAGQAVRDVKAAAAFDVFPELRDAAGQGRISREKAGACQMACVRGDA